MEWENSMTGAQQIVQCLVKHGVTCLFEFPGGTIAPILHALSKTPRIETVSFRHESGAIFAAEAYARVTGLPGICMATSGPGATNLVTGIANAYLDFVPVIAITGQVRTGEIKAATQVRQKGFQEVDIVSICTPITKGAFQIRGGKDIVGVFDHAFHLCMHGGPGPVLIDIPKDIQLGEIELEEPVEATSMDTAMHVPDESEFLDHLHSALQSCKSPLVIVGGGAQCTADYISRLCRQTRIPVVYSLLGKGVVSDECDGCLGMFGWHGSRAANWAVKNADVVLALGVRFSMRQTGAHIEEFAPSATIFHVDIDPVGLCNSGLDTIQACSDLRTFLPRLCRQIETYRCPSSWFNSFAGKGEYRSRFDNEYGHNEHERLLLDLFAALGTFSEEIIMTTDVGQHQMWAAQMYPAVSARSFLTSGGLGAMGYGLPAAIGAHYADPRKTIVNLTGDGSFQLSMQELSVIQHRRLPIKIIMLDNSSLGYVRQYQEDACDGIYTSTVLGNGYSAPDFLQLAKAFGIAYRQLKEGDNPADIIPPFLDSPNAEFLHVHIDRSLRVRPELGREKRRSVTI